MKKQNPKREQKENLNDDTFIFSNNKSNLIPDETILYTIIDQHNFIDNDNNPRLSEDSNRVYAKKIIKNNTQKYLIKVDNTNKFYNPLSPVSSIKPTKILQTISIPKNQFKQVNQEIFSMYLNFLRSKNEAWLHNAERENY